MNEGKYNQQAERAAAPSNPLPGALSYLDGAISGLSQTMDAVRDRLDRVLSPAMPSTDGNKPQLTAATPVMAPMTDDVRGMAARVEFITARLNDVLNRLEV